MSDIVNDAVKAINGRLGGRGVDGSVKFVLEDGDGAVMIDDAGAKAAGDGEADCTLTADVETFRGIMKGELDPTSAFMNGRLKVDGDMGLAMKLASMLS